MFDKKKLLLFVATAALVAACGGGGGDTPPPYTSGGGDSIGSEPTEEPSTDQQLAGYLSITANQVVYVRRDRTMYLPVTLERLEDIHGINDVAPGYTGNEEIGEPYRPWDGVEYAPPMTLAPAAPMQHSGYV